MLRKAFLPFLFIAISQSAWSFGEMKSLEGSTVLLSGDIEKVSCPAFGKYDCLTFPNNLYKFSLQNICFTTNITCGYDCKGFIADKQGTRSLYVLGSAYNRELEMDGFTQFQCPALY
ncbi:hypothetical protein [Pseudomonas defluvii]|uniref:hypothetical protein n=1 Tax=Pseudomonas defluvii TaxID=1876757 RepID=UPI0009F38897|nr:hypothetical protein [Pseudomonas defluvii]